MLFRRVWPLFLMSLVAAAPESAHYRLQADELFWFLAFTDGHIDAPPASGEQSVERLERATGELAQAVQPRFILNLGDLTDATGGGLVPLGQQQMEWQSYQAIVDGNGMTPDRYFDLPGNHDQYLDGELSWYLGYSVKGRAHQQVNHAWTHRVNGTDYLFVALASCGSDGLPWPEDTVGLDSVDLDFLDQAAKEHPEADILTVFSHHPAAYYVDGKQELYEFLQQQGATAFLHGHTHGYSISWQNDTLHLEIDSLGKSAADDVALLAFDGRGLSARIFTLGSWPMVLVTAPLDGKLAKDHKLDYMVPTSVGLAPIRALAFHPEGIDEVEASIDGQLAVAMEAVADHVWQGHFDTAQLQGVPHTLTVTAWSGGQSDSHSTTFYLLDDGPPPEPSPEPAPEVEADLLESPDLPAAEAVNGEVLAGDEATGAELEVAGAAAELADGQADGQAPIAPAQPGVGGLLPAGSSGGCDASPQPVPSWPLLVPLLLLAWVKRGRRSVPLTSSKDGGGEGP